MKNYNYTIVAILISIMYWVMDSMIHWIIYPESEYEIIPSDSNELWMRVIIATLVTLFGLYADKHTKSLLKKEEEKRIIFSATVSSSHHILNNLLNQMQFFKVKAEESNAFDASIVELFEQSMIEGKELIDRLSNVEELTEVSIKSSVHPE